MVLYRRRQSHDGRFNRYGNAGELSALWQSMILFQTTVDGNRTLKTVSLLRASGDGPLESGAAACVYHVERIGREPCSKPRPSARRTLLRCVEMDTRNVAGWGRSCY